MSEIPAIFPPEIRAYLRKFVLRKRKVSLVKALGIAVAAGLMGMLLSCGVDRLQPLPGGVRLLLLVCDLATVLILLARPMFTALRRHADWVSTAEEIEGQNPAFAQRLLTVTSQLLTPADQRASQQILDHLVGEVRQQAGQGHAERLIPWWWARRAWIVAGAMFIGACGLSFVPWLDLPRLMHRFAAPLADLAPVTTTRITLLDPTSKEIGVSQGEPLAISASAQRLGDDSLTLCVSDDGKNWSQQTMEPTAEGQFRLSIASVDRDLQFYLKGGDAVTSVHEVRVLRRPAVAEFRVRYTYPAYTGLQPRTISNTDGVIEAPVGSEADIVIIATEPLADASLLVNGKEFDSAPTVESTSRQIKLTIDRDASCSLAMSSLRGVKGAGPQTMAIHAIVDEPPLVRLLEPATDLRLSPRDVIDVSYQALDQYGLASLALRVRINGSREIQTPIAIHGDARLQQDTIPLDLATLEVKIGDVVTLQLQGEDVSGQKQTSPTRSILIVPRAIDINTHERIVELQQAVSLADAWVADIDSAKHSADESRQYADPEADKRADALASTARYLGSAFETSMLLRQSLLRVAGRSGSAQMTDGLANGVDLITLHSGAMGRVASALVGAKPVDDAGMNAINDSAAAAQDLARQIRAVAEGESASAILIDRADLNLSAAQSSAHGRHHQQAIERARQEIADDVKDLGLDPNAGDLEPRLQDRVNAEQQWTANQKPIDFVPPANEFVAALRQPQPATTDLEPRLAAAADVEAVRPDTDMAGARDLQLASRAAAAIAEAELSVSETTGIPAWTTEALAQYPAALQSLRDAHALTRESPPAHSPEQIKQIDDAAEIARARMDRWIRGGDVASTQPATGPSEKDLALSADAEMAQHDYNKAAELDARLQAATRPSATEQPAQIPLPREKMDRTMNELQQLDQIAAAQANVQKQTEDAEPRSGIDPPDGLADKQQKIADDIEKARRDADPDAARDGDDSKHDATEAIQGAQEQLAQMPQQMDAAERAADAARAASARLAAAQNNARGAQGDGVPAANLAADQARQEAADAQQRLADALRPISPEAMQQMADNLRRFNPETTDASAAMDQQLTPAMNSLNQSLQASASGGDNSGVGRSASQSLAALAAVQSALRGAQAQITARDPLVAAKWFAQAAKSALSHHPPDYQFALTQQQQTSMALSEAWNQRARDIARQRVANIPGLASIYEPTVVAADAQGMGASSSPLLQPTPALREWGHLRALDLQSLNSSIHDTDPAGYEDALKLYFEAMNRPKDQKN